MKNIKKLLGAKIQNIRKMQGYSQIEFAEKIGLSTNALSVIETGNGFLTAETLEKILTTLNIEPDELFSFGGLKSDEDIYSDVIRLVNSVKSDRNKLTKIYSFLKILL